VRTSPVKGGGLGVGVEYGGGGGGYGEPPVVLRPLGHLRPTLLTDPPVCELYVQQVRAGRWSAYRSLEHVHTEIHFAVVELHSTSRRACGQGTAVQWRFCVPSVLCHLHLQSDIHVASQACVRFH
jgi:hypothetical protein